MTYFPDIPRKRKKRRKKKKKPKRVGAKSVYKTEEWKRLRYRALKMSNGCCELCGASKRDGAVMQVDHVKPVHSNPELAFRLSNLQVLCASCNWGKGGTEDDWREPSLKILMSEAVDIDG